MIITIVIVFGLLLVSEYWWRSRRPHDEISRKFVHITIGSFAAFWPWYLSRHEIVLLAGLFLAGVLVSKYFNLFKAIHAVQRPTWGEACFAVSVGALALLADNPWIYAVALLHMSLADGLAAIIGTKFGHGNSYRVFGHLKSIVGTVVFFVTSLGLLLGYEAASGAELAIPLLIVTATVAALAENIAVRGLDNLFVPLFIFGVLAYLA